MAARRRRCRSAGRVRGVVRSARTESMRSRRVGGGTRLSLDGFIAGPGDNKDNPFGTKGHRLHQWLGDDGESVSGFRPSDEPSRTVFDELMSTGAVITGRRTGDFVDYWGGDHHDGVPIFVLTHRAPTSTPL